MRRFRRSRLGDWMLVFCDLQCSPSMEAAVMFSRPCISAPSDAFRQGRMRSEIMPSRDLELICPGSGGLLSRGARRTTNKHIGKVITQACCSRQLAGTDVYQSVVDELSQFYYHLVEN